MPLRSSQTGARSGSENEAEEEAPGDRSGRPLSAAQRAKESLLVSAARARAAAPEQTTEEKVVAEEQDIMRHLMQKQALKAVQELAAGVTYTKSMATGWKAPLSERRMSQKKQQVGGRSCQGHCAPRAAASPALSGAPTPAESLPGVHAPSATLASNKLPLGPTLATTPSVLSRPAPSPPENS